MKKNFLLLAGVATMFAACSQDDFISENENNGNAIGFSTIMTRAAETTTTSMTDFRVWGYYGEASPVTASSTSLYMDVKPTSSGTHSGTTTESGYEKFTYSPLKFWPLNGVIDFFAVSPKDAYSSTASTTIEYNVTAPAASGHTDLLFARALNQSRQSARVKMDFKHALSQIRFEARSAYETMKFAVSSIELVNVLPNGTVNIASTGTNPWSITAANTPGNGLKWSADGTAQNYSFGLASTGSAVGNATVVYKSDTDNPKYVGIISKTGDTETGALMIIPQTLTAGTVTANSNGINKIGTMTTSEAATAGYTYNELNNGSYIKVTYAAYDVATGVELIPAGTEQVFGLDATFLPGVKYTYQLTLKGILQPIEFQAQVEPWAPVTLPGVEI